METPDNTSYGRSAAYFAEHKGHGLGAKFDSDAFSVPEVTRAGAPVPVHFANSSFGATGSDLATSIRNHLMASKLRCVITTICFRPWGIICYESPVRVMKSRESKFVYNTILCYHPPY